MRNQETGQFGERLVAQLLEARGHKIVRRNWQTRWLEIDLITQIKGALWVVEVKTRQNQQFGSPAAAVTPAKLRKLHLACQMLASQNPGLTIKCVVASLILQPKPRLQLIKIDSI